MKCEVCNKYDYRKALAEIDRIKKESGKKTWRARLSCPRCGAINTFVAINGTYYRKEE